MEPLQSSGKQSSHLLQPSVRRQARSISAIRHGNPFHKNAHGPGRHDECIASIQNEKPRPVAVNLPGANPSCPSISQRDGIVESLEWCRSSVDGLDRGSDEH